MLVDRSPQPLCQIVRQERLITADQQHMAAAQTGCKAEGAGQCVDRPGAGPCIVQHRQGGSADLRRFPRGNGTAIGLRSGNRDGVIEQPVSGQQAQRLGPADPLAISSGGDDNGGRRHG